MAPSEPAASPAIPAWLGHNAKPTALDRAPAIGEVMGEFAGIWSSRFMELAATPVEMTFRSLRISRVAQLIEERGRSPICATIRAPEWNAEVGLVLQRHALSVLVEALFGGEGDDDGENDEATLSAIERQIVQVFGRQVAETLQDGLAPHLPAKLQFDRILAKPDFGPMSKSENPVGIVTLTLAALGRAGEVDLLLPLALLDSIAEALDVEAVETPVEHDPRWSRQLGDEVGRAMTQLRAVIDMPAMSLGAILAMAPGQVLALPASASGKVKLSCGANDLFRCDLGQLAGHYTLRIEDPLSGSSDPARSLSLDLATAR
jgi:flagellar motor switch protein FliM